ncbi:MAG: hypothetical protein NTW19_02465 [Planctomycetota bacterium]|nr:hypothetical protein [Planctomycetota bacterium]
MNIFRWPAAGREAPTQSLRERLLGEHSRFLSNAASRPAGRMRIPRLRVDRGGFTAMMRNSDTRRGVLNNAFVFFFP